MTATENELLRIFRYRSATDGKSSTVHLFRRMLSAQMLKSYCQNVGGKPSRMFEMATKVLEQNRTK